MLTTPKRTKKIQNKKSEKSVTVQYGLYNSWSEPSSERHQLLILLDPDCKATLKWRISGRKKQQSALAGKYVLFIEKNTPNELNFEKETALVSLSFTDAFSEEIAPDYPWSGILIKTWFDIIKADVFIHHFWNNFQKLCKNNEEDSSHYLDAAGIILVAHFLRNHRKKRTIKEGAGLSPAQLQRITDYIDGHFTKHIRITDIYRMVGLGKNQFCKLFKNSTGMTPRQYVILKRIRYAQQLFEEGELRVSEIALETGFFDQSHLRNCMRRFGNMDLSRKK